MWKADWKRVSTPFLTHGPSSTVFHGLLRPSAHTHDNPYKCRGKFARMTSTSSAVGQWPSSRVRDTFLGYFKENGHTFGMDFQMRPDGVNGVNWVYQCPHPRSYLIQIQHCCLPMLA